MPRLCKPLPLSALLRATPILVRQLFPAPPPVGHAPPDFVDHALAPPQAAWTYPYLVTGGPAAAAAGERYGRKGTRSGRVHGGQLWAPSGCCGRSGALETMAVCARAALLLCALQVLAQPGTATNGTDAQGKSAGGEEARCGGLPLHVRRPRGKFHAFAVDSVGEGETETGAGVPLAHRPPAERDYGSPLLWGSRPAWCAELEFPWHRPSGRRLKLFLSLSLELCGW